MAHSSDERNTIIQILRENPNIGYACKKVGIVRATHYRWMKDNVSYREKVNGALKEGRTTWTENAEAMLMKLIRDGNFRAIQFFLVHNDTRYIPKRSRFVEPLSELERRHYEQLQKQIARSTLPNHIKEPILRAMRNYGIIKDEKK